MSEIPITLLVEQGIAKDIQNKGLAEIALRQKDAKFKATYRRSWQRDLFCS